MTDKQEQVLNFIREFIRERGFAPVSRDIQKRFGWSSQTAAMNHLRALERKGVIRTTPGISRSIVIL